MSTVLVVGKNGQLATALRNNGGRAHGFSLSFVGRPEIDLENPDGIAAAVAASGADLVINAAAYTAVDNAEDDEERAHLVNARAAGEIAKGAHSINAPIIHVSTDYVFDGRSAVPYREDMPTAPIGAYGRSKLAGEIAVATHNKRHVIARTAWVYSPYGANFIKSMLKLGATRPELGIVADQLGCPTSADDLAEALLVIGHRLLSEPDNDALYGPCNVTGTGAAAWYDLACAVFRYAQKDGFTAPLVKPISTADFPTKAVRPANSRLDPTRLLTHFGYALPQWQDSVARDVAILMKDQAA